MSLAAITGCADQPAPTATQATQPTQPAQRAAERPRATDASARENDQAGDPATQSAGRASASDRGYKVAGMVGQVNGEAIYADRVFEPMHEQLRGLGQRLPREQFRREAESLIVNRLREIVTNSLLLGEAQRDLSERQRMGLQRVIRLRREEMIRKHGRGSAAVADETLRRETGKGLQKTLEEMRQGILVQRYMRQKLYPRINVTRRDIERYYRDHPERYQPSSTRTFHLIQAADEDAAQQIAAAIEAGEPIESLATDPQLNLFQPGTGGEMTSSGGEGVLRYEKVNETIRSLNEGEVAGPIEAGGEQWFVKVEQVERPEGRSLIEVQREIEQILENQQFDRLSRESHQQLYERGSYNSVQQMAQSLLEIAMNRYAMPADDGSS